MSGVIPETLPAQIADLFNRISELERRTQNKERTGTIHEVDPEKGLARVMLEEDDGTGKPFLTPWIPWRESAMGANRTHMPPSVGQQVKVTSESGDLTDAEIENSLPSDEIERPSKKGNEFILSKVGDFELRVSDGGDLAIVKVGSTELELRASGLVVKAPDIEFKRS